MKANQVRIFAIGAATGALASQILRPGVLEILIVLAIVIALSYVWQRRVAESALGFADPTR
ncbi:MAG: hypothetical protein KDB22_13605 [Planctomycetales bacterium]|nr:hypothetical protein [Planctomycetales bacterium]